MTAAQARRRAERLVREHPYLFDPRTLADDLAAVGTDDGAAYSIVWALLDAGRLVLTPEWLLMTREDKP